MLKTLRVAVFLTIRSFLRGNRGILVTPVVIMFIIYINLLFTPALIQGAIDQNQSQLENVFTSDLVLSPPVSQSDFTARDAKLARIRGIEGVAASTAMYHAGDRISHGKTGDYWPVEVVEPTSFQKVFTNDITLGAFLKQNDNTGIMLGARIAGNGYEHSASYGNTLGTVKLGDTVDATLSGGIIKSFTVRAVFDNKFIPADSRAFITQSAFEKLAPTLRNHATAIYVKLKHGVDRAQVETQLKKILPGAKIQGSKELGAAVQEQAETVRTINNILSTLSLIVASITIFIVTYVDLITRRKQIGIERAIGIKGSAVIISYLLRALICTVIGIVLAGLVFVHVLVPYFQHRPFTFPNGSVSLVSSSRDMVGYATVLLVIAVISALIPAWRSVKIKILKAIWD